MIRAFFATDVHGSNLCFRKFLNASGYYKTDYLILGGDVTGKVMVPIIEEQGEIYTVKFLGQEKVVRGREELAVMEKRISDSGSYPFLTRREQMAELAKDRHRMDSVFKELIVQRLGEWMSIAEQFSNSSKAKVYMTGGNDDEPYVDQILEQADRTGSIIHPVDKVVYLGDLHEMISVPYSNMTPWKCPRDISEAELSDKIEQVASKVKDYGNAIFNFHAPPKDSDLDTCPKLDTTTHPPKPIMQQGRLVMYGAGSTSVRLAIEKYQPLAGLHGHIHESMGVTKIGRTHCFNPGSEYAEGILRGVIIALDDRKVRSYQLTSG